MSCCDERDLCCVLRKLIAAPDHVQIRSHEEQIELINFARLIARNFEYVKRGTHFSKGSLQARSICVCSAEPEQRIPRAKAIVQRRAVVQPNMGEASAGPRRRYIRRVVRIGAIAKLPANNG